MAHKAGCWPRTTLKQRAVLLGAEDYGHIKDTLVSPTILALLYKGFVRHTENGWYAITQRGFDYLRFGMRR